MKYLGITERVIVSIIILGFFLFFGSMAIEQWTKKDKVRLVSEWKDVFDVECSCGNHLHCEPYDKEHYKIVCAKCGKVYEKDWSVQKYKWTDGYWCDYYGWPNSDYRPKRK